MSVGVLLVSHPGVASSLLNAARTMLRVLTTNVEVLEVGWRDAPERVQQQANVMLRDLDQGSGVLVLTDLYGSTPANGVRDLEHGRKLARVSGLNLPMLLRVLTYCQDRNLEDLTIAARDGGKNGINDDISDESEARS